jgi:predicted GNAT family acetyltransferase
VFDEPTDEPRVAWGRLGRSFIALPEADMRSRHPAIDVRHNAAEHRFEAIVDGELARVDYRLAGGVMQMVHTEVPMRLTGRGIAAQLVRAAFAHAQSAGLKVAPLCSYVRDYVRRHPETRPLLAA